MWKNKKVLVTGGDGFIGSHLTERLVAEGSNVTVFVKGLKLNNIFHLVERVKVISGDIGDRFATKLIVKNNPDIIFHLAALAYVNYSFDHPVEVMRVNLGGTQNVLEACRKLPELKRVVVTSSSEVYGTTCGDKIDEGHPLYPSSPYAASKVAADRLAYSYWRTYGLPVAIIRPFNTYGPRHTYDVIPKFIKMVLRGETPTIYGSGFQSRDFTYVSDMVEGFLCIGSEEEVIGTVVNFGTGKDVTIKDLAHKIIELSGNQGMEPEFLPTRMAEVDRLCCDNTLARCLFGWRPLVGLEEGLRRNIEWERKKLSNV